MKQLLSMGSIQVNGNMLNFFPLVYFVFDSIQNKIHVCLYKYLQESETKTKNHSKLPPVMVFLKEPYLKFGTCVFGSYKIWLTDF